jgi:hypothetical protein
MTVSLVIFGASDRCSRLRRPISPHSVRGWCCSRLRIVAGSFSARGLPSGEAAADADRVSDFAGYFDRQRIPYFFYTGIGIRKEVTTYDNTPGLLDSANGRGWEMQSSRIQFKGMMACFWRSRDSGKRGERLAATIGCELAPLLPASPMSFVLRFIIGCRSFCGNSTTSMAFPGSRQRVLTPYPSDLMSAWAISPRVNSPLNDDADLIEAFRINGRVARFPESWRP